MKIEDNKVVVIDYTLKDNDGEIIDSSESIGPLAYLHGAGNIVEGLEEALTGKGSGDKLTVKVEPAKGYGAHHEEMQQEIPKELFGGVERVEVGMQFQSETDQGPVLVTVINVEDDMVTVDGNHPLAGVDLNFDVEVVEVRDATKQELEQGHVYSEDAAEDQHSN